MAKHPCPPEAQEASDAFIKLRAACDKVEELALVALTKERIAFAAMLAIEPKLLAMDNGPMEEKLYGLAAVGAKGRSMHLAGSRMMRRFFVLPVPSPYEHDDRPESVAVKVKMPRRR
jgi:hypothetical protein